MLRRLTYIALNPFFQALFISVLIVLLIPAGINKYRCEQVDMTSNFDKTQYVYADLDHDGTSERIHTFFNLSGNVGIVLLKEIYTIGQWNFKGVYEDISPRFMLGDYNHDGLDEIYIFTKAHDSVLLNVLAYTKKPEILVRDRFITKLGRNLQNPDYLFVPGEVTDMNGDGSGDLVFCINAGHSRRPRNVFIYDVVHDTLYQSPTSGAFIGQIILQNIDGDPFPEILPSTYASSNYNKEAVEYSDTSSWLILLDHDLEFMFNPIEFKGPAGGVNSHFIDGADGRKLIIVGAVHGYPHPDTSTLLITDLNGTIIMRINAKSGYGMEFPGIYTPPQGYPGNTVLGLKHKEGIFSIDHQLNITRLSDIKFGIFKPDFVDIDLDQQDEIILLKPDQQKFLLLRNNFSHPVELDMPIQATNPIYSVKLNGTDPPQLSVQGDRVWKLFDYGINPLWRFRFLIWLGIYLANLAFILMIRKLYSIQLQKRYETEKKISTLQLSSVKAQMEPHFIMNTINTIGSSIYRQKPDEAYQLLLNFSGMVRSLLLSSDKLTRSLKEELDFVKNYLELEKSRFAEVFSYNIQVNDDVDPESIIPKMIIQLHTENALKHGILPKKSGGFIDILVSRETDHLLLTITDNGIGRNLSSKNISQSTGKGMKILGQFIETYNKHNKHHLRQEIFDLTDNDNKPAGTEVKVYIPMDFNTDIF